MYYNAKASAPGLESRVAFRDALSSTQRGAGNWAVSLGSQRGYGTFYRGLRVRTFIPAHPLAALH